MISCNLQGIWCWKLARCFPFTWPCAVTSDLPEGETQTWRSMCMCGKLTWTLTPTPQPKDVTEHIRVFKNVHDYWRGFPPAGSNKLTGSWYLFLLSYNYIIIHIYIYIYSFHFNHINSMCFSVLSTHESLWKITRKGPVDCGKFSHQKGGSSN